MSDELKNIFNTGECLTQNEMLDYLAGRLHGERLRKAELHIADCELCADAVEGLSLLTETEQHSSIEKLENRIKERVKEQSVLYVLFKRAVAIAAVLLLVIGGAFYLNELINKKQTQVAENSSEKKSELEKSVESIHLKNDSIYDKQTIQFTPPVGNGKPIEDVKAPDEQPHGGFVFKNVPREENQSVSNDNSFDDSPAPVENKVTDEESVTAMDGDKFDLNNEKDVSTKSITSPTTVTVTTEQLNSTPNYSYSGSSTQMSPSMNLDEVQIISGKKNKTGKDKNANGESQKQDQPDQFTDSVSIDIPSDLFNQAMQYKSSGEKEKAIEKLDELIKLNNNFKPQAMWEKALLLIDLNKNDKAKTVLTDLSKIESAYKQQAIDKLKEL